MQFLRTVFKEGNDYGKLLVLAGILVICPVMVIPFYPDEQIYAQSFLIPGAAAVITGLAICMAWPVDKDKAVVWRSNISKGSSPVLFIWCISFVIGAIPFVLSNELSPILALFESVSGWTTTGLTVVNVEEMPHIFLFHRSFMQYCGGLGFVIMVSMVMQARNAASLYNAEGHQDRLKPSFRGTSKTLGKIYVTWLILGTAVYVIMGMSPFQAVCHTMSALSTAGYSTEADSIGAFSSVPIDIFTIILMIVGASSFVVVKKIMELDFRSVIRDSEFKFMIILTVITSVAVAINLIREEGTSVSDAFLRSVFGIVTTFSTTGYGIEDYSEWPAFSLGILMILMVIGGCAGSTAGGIKMNRAYFMLRNMTDYIKQQVRNPRHITRTVYRKNNESMDISTQLASSTSGFIIIYLMFLIAGVLLITLTEDCSLGDAAFEFTSALGTVGISCGLTSPDASSMTLLIEIAAMILGRLEIIMVLVGMYNIVKKLSKVIRKK